MMDVEFTELDEADRKVLEWKREARQSAPVYLSNGLDLSLSPLDSIPVHPKLSPFQVLSSADILTQLVSIPSVITTAGASIVFGAVVALILTLRTGALTGVTRTDFLGRLARKLLRLVLLVAACTVYGRYLRRRFPHVQRVSQYQNLSSTADAPCFVANHVLTITNSQAGTHADGPHHFCRSLSHRNFDDAHYSGDVVVLDVTAELMAGQSPLDCRAITVAIVQKALERLPRAFVDGSRPLWRLLLVTRCVEETPAAPQSLLVTLLGTRMGDSAARQLQKTLGMDSATSARKDAEEERSRYAFLFPETVEYLQRIYPRLLLVGIDSPSLDAPAAEPLAKQSHGALLRCGMAMLENLQFSRLQPLLSTGVEGKRGVLVGSMLTIFSAMQNYDDARGCSVVFFPEETTM